MVVVLVHTKLELKYQFYPKLELKYQFDPFSGIKNTWIPGSVYMVYIRILAIGPECALRALF